MRFLYYSISIVAKKSFIWALAFPVLNHLPDLEKEIGVNFTKPDEILNTDLPEENGVEPEAEEASYR